MCEGVRVCKCECDLFECVKHPPHTSPPTQSHTPRTGHTLGVYVHVGVCVCRVSVRVCQVGVCACYVRVCVRVCRVGCMCGVRVRV